MKKLLAIVLCICLTPLLRAQNMKVVDFRLLENDLTANTRGTEKMDQNGDKAALIKIVTPERGFTFDGGTLGIVATEERNGEIWLYVPRRAMKLIVQHKDYGVMRDFNYPIPIEGGRTYEMYIDIGIGRYVTITSQIANSTIYIDGENCGMAPIRHKYLNYGRHTFRALKDRYEGEQSLMITTNDNQHRVITVEQKDMSDHFGDVTVAVENNADIFFEGRKVGTGTWKTQLREGNYTIETRKADCDPVKTTFNVVAQKQNELKAMPPTLHTGYLRLVTRPSDAEALYYGTRHLSVEEPNVLPIGTYQVNFSKKGYVPKTQEYTVTRNAITTDTITLKHIEYVASKTFYFGVGASLRAMMGLTGLAGFVFKNHDLQVHYTFGLSSSDHVYCYTASETNNEYQSTVNFKQSSFGAKYGYQLVLNDRLNKLAITPQVGICVDRLTASLQNGTNLYADGASATCVSIGVKMLYAPIQHFYLFVAPEYDIAVQKDDNFQRLVDAGSVTAGGFQALIGLIVNF